MNEKTAQSGRIRTAKSYWIFCLVLLPLAIFAALDHAWAPTADIWETAATVRAVSQNFFHPANPLLPLPGNTSVRFTPYTLFWGLVMRLTGFDVFTVMGLADVVNYVLFVMGLALWITRQFRQPRLALILLLTMLIVWRTGYEYAQAYQLGFFLASLSYVGTFAYALCFLALACLRKYLDDDSRIALLGYIVLSIVVSLTHPVTVAFEFLTAFAMLFVEKNLRRTLWLQTVPLLTLGVTVLWPYFDYWTVLTKGSTVDWFPAALFAQQVARMGTLLLGLVIIAYYGIRRRYTFIVLGTVFCLGIYALSGALKFAMGSRFLLYGAIFIHLGIAIYISEHWPQWKKLSWRQPKQLLSLAFALLIVLPALPYRTHETVVLARDFVHLAFNRPAPESTADRFGFLAGHLSDKDVVMAEGDTGWPVPTISGAKLVSQQKGNPLIQDDILQRKHDADAFFESPLTLEQRIALLRRYHATHVLVDSGLRVRWDRTFLEQVDALGERAAVHGDIILYRVRA